MAGDSGAPLEKDEIEIIESVLDKVKPFMPKAGVKAVEKQGVYVIDEDGDYTTTLVKGKECAFVYFEDEIAKCAIEKAYNEGLIDFKKPISCHLYPVRITETKEYTAVNYHRWEICKAACSCGKKLGVPVYKFLKGPLERKFGKDWFAELDNVALSLANKELQE